MPENEQLRYLLDHPNEACQACEHPLRDHLEGQRIVPCKAAADEQETPGVVLRCGCGMEC
jgi:hypothetical protein